MRSFLGLVVLALAACSGSDSSGPSGPPADVAGNYSVAVTNGSNGCGFANWKENETSQNIPFKITQTGSEVTGDVEGATGLFVALWLGTRTYKGTVGGTSVNMTAFGTNNQVDKGCSYTVSSTIDGTLTGNALQGSITYTAKTNGSPDCGTKEGCLTTQSFSGSRPPK